MLHSNVSTRADPFSSNTVTWTGMQKSFGKAFNQDNEDVQNASSITTDNASKISAANVSREPFEVTHLTNKEKLCWKFLDDLKRKPQETRSAIIGSTLESPPAFNSGGAHAAVEQTLQDVLQFGRLPNEFKQSCH